LRHGRAPQRLHVGELRIAARLGEERLRDFGQALGVALAAVLDVELEAAGRLGRRWLED
jgi:hypothetical protein